MFLKMMVLDGCFLFEILHVVVNTQIRRGCSDTDPCFSVHGIHHKIPYIRRDLLLIENQLPLLLLKTLIAFQPTLVQNFTTGRVDEIVKNTNLGLHTLDLHRQNLLSPTKQKQAKHQHQTPLKPSSKNASPIRCSVKLHEAGVKFKESKTKSLTDIRFNSRSGVLHLPRILVDDSTECTFLNIVAFEHLHMSIDNHDATSYVRFMREIVDSEKDVSKLHRKNVVLNSLGSDKAVAELFNGFAGGAMVVGQIRGLEADATCHTNPDEERGKEPKRRVRKRI